MDIFVYFSAFFNSKYNGCKIVVGYNHICNFFCHVCACYPHSNTDTCAFQTWCIVDAVTGHRHNLSKFFETFDNTHLVFGADTRKHRNIFQPFQKFLVIKFVDFQAKHNLIFVFSNAYFFCYGKCSCLVITCNHNWSHSRKPASFNRLFHFFSWWINHPDKPHKNKVIFPILFVRFVTFVLLFVSKSQNTKCFIRHLIVCHQNLNFLLVGKFKFFSVNQNFVATTQNIVNSTFCPRNIILTVKIYSCHKFSLAVKRYFVNTLVFLLYFTFFVSTFFCKVCKCCFGRVTNISVFVFDTVIAKCHTLQKCNKIFIYNVIFAFLFLSAIKK